MNCSTPYMPRFEIVNVPPSRSSLLQLAVARARDDIGAGRRDLGDRQPLGVANDRHDEALRRATAMPTSALGKTEDLVVGVLRRSRRGGA